MSSPLPKTTANAKTTFTGNNGDRVQQTEIDKPTPSFGTTSPHLPSRTRPAPSLFTAGFCPVFSRGVSRDPHLAALAGGVWVCYCNTSDGASLIQVKPRYW